MAINKIHIFILICVCGLSTTLASQVANSKEKAVSQSYLPKVFLIGEYEQAYEQLIVDYNQLFMTTFNNNMIKAYEVWSSILIDMEDYAKSQQFDLSGLKLWINLFINADGSIEHIVYFPKPNSRNLSFDHLTAFMLSFSKNYRLSVPVNSKCSHYGSASFPTFLKKN